MRAKEQTDRGARQVRQLPDVPSKASVNQTLYPKTRFAYSYCRDISIFAPFWDYAVEIYPAQHRRSRVPDHQTSGAERCCETSRHNVFLIECNSVGGEELRHPLCTDSALAYERSRLRNAIEEYDEVS